ncbi:uncharacterized protein A1O9_04710 [Exophiala aquamarina CBS 119918]|uniref:Major facilitator superfamily (MFS) profile domain-containing protein n=1 Tax=Exophiala aquamarina CBS 119918 TaxID=1182545 RepID=A0A072PJF6_9EURO|nr:uncharacterized protein A1O9_04710 [Exophiala aquamarina CBS 119918]KEF59862.1 hypothetical protein A1O9_04710 [Exophiala aquamarina CBS 119918]
MHHPDKPEEAHVDHAGVDDQIMAQDDISPSLKITQDSYWDNKRGVALCLLFNMAAFEYGLDQGMVNGFQAMPGFLLDFGYKDSTLPGGMGISTTVQQLMGSLVSLGMFFSTLISGWVCDKIGRKGGLLVGLFLIVVSTTVQMAAISFGGLYSGRILLGLANGFLLVCSQLYMQETMPSNLRSLSYTFFQFWISFGTLIGVIVNNATAKILTRASYRIPLGILYIIPLLLGVVLFFLPETPRYLASQNKHIEAHNSLRFLRDSCYTDLQIKEEITEITHSLEVDREIVQTVGYRELVRGPNLKRTCTCVGLGLFAAASGVPFITQYGVYFFMLSGDTEPFRDVIILVCCGIAGVMFTPLFTGKIGKRPILMFGGIVQALCMLGLALPYSIRGIDTTSGRVIIAMCCIYLFFASATTGPFAWQVAGEIPNQRLRGHTFGVAAAITYLSGWSITFTIPYFINPTALNWGAQYGYIWVASNALITVFTWLLVPETNRRTLEEIDEMYLTRVSIRSFVTYDCLGSKDARLQAVRASKTERLEVQEASGAGN